MFWRHCLISKHQEPIIQWRASHPGRTEPSSRSKTVKQHNLHRQIIFVTFRNFFLPEFTLFPARTSGQTASEKSVHYLGAELINLWAFLEWICRRRHHCPVPSPPTPLSPQHKLQIAKLKRRKTSFCLFRWKSEAWYDPWRADPTHSRIVSAVTLRACFLDCFFLSLCTTFVIAFSTTKENRPAVSSVEKNFKSL